MPDDPEIPEYDPHAMPPAFSRWWRNHRHSGRAEKDDMVLWSITPNQAWKVDRYRAEFSSDTGESVKVKQHYGAAEIESWAQDAKEHDMIWEKWCQEHGKENNYQPTMDDFLAELRKGSERLAKKSKPPET